ncbi:N-acetylneuraminate synthase family protein [Pectobacterium brasiliense]
MMADILLRDGKTIGSYKKPYIIAEVNSSHNGNIGVAKEMILKAKEAGCDCVKFQSWSTDSLYSKDYYDSNPIAKRIISKFSLPETELLELSRYCNEIGISFSSTPYSRGEVDFLVNECNVPYIKIASQDVNNYPYLEYIASKNVPIILSTGMAELDEIKKAVAVIEKQGNRKIILLHCISIYPAEPETINLNNIVGLREIFSDYPVGFSDHSLGTEMAVAATALGSCAVEKHLTLDKSKMGMDNNMAIEPEEMKTLVHGCHNVFSAMGNKERMVSAEEYEQRKKMRRSIVFARNLPAGHKLSIKDMDFKRPGTGLAPELTDSLVGRVLSRDVEADRLISQDDISGEL